MKLTNITVNALRFYEESNIYWGYATAQMVEALRYKPEGGGFDSRWNH